MALTIGRVRRAASLGVTAVLALVGCARSGQTGSPADGKKEPGGKVPVYETPADFGARDEEGDPADCPGVEPTRHDEPGIFVRAAGGYLVVYHAGVLIYDLRDSMEPRLVGELPLEGTPRQMRVDEGFVTLALETPNRVNETTIPEEPVLERKTRLLRIDWSDPAAPSIAAETAITDEFWHFAPAGEHWAVLTSRPVPGDPSQCGYAEQRSRWYPTYCGPSSFQVASYSVRGDSLELESSVELAQRGQDALVGDGLYAAVDNSTAASEAPELNVVRLHSDGRLTKLGPLEASHEVTAVALQGSMLLVALRGDEAALQVFDVQDRDRPELLSTTPLSDEAFRLTFLPSGDGVLATRSADGPTRGSTLVELEDPTEPTAAALPEVAEGVVLGSTILGVGPDDRNLFTILTLWDISEPEKPSRSALAETDWSYQRTSPPRWTFDAALGCLVYPTSPREQVGLACVEGDSISVLGEAKIPGRTGTPVVVGSYIYGATEEEEALYSISVDLSSSELELGEPPIYWESATEDPARQVLEEATVGSFRAELIREDDQLRVELRPLEDPSEPFQAKLEHFVDKLVAVGDRLILFGAQAPYECDPSSCFYDVEVDNGCPSPSRPGVTIVNTSNSPHVEASLLIDYRLDIPDGANDCSFNDWLGYVDMGDGRFFMPVEQVACYASGSLCKYGFENGVRAEAGDADRQYWGYILDVNAPDGPRLGAGQHLGDVDKLDLMGYSRYPVEYRTLVAGDTLGFVGEETLRDEEGDALQDEAGNTLVRYWLSRAVVGADGSIELLDSINTPGPSLALSKDGQAAFSIAPDADGAEGADVSPKSVHVAIHRLSLEGGGATIQETLALAGRYWDSVGVGDRATVVLGPEEGCEANAPTQFVSVLLNEDPLDQRTLDLPFENWAFDFGQGQPGIDFAEPWDSGAVVLKGGPSPYYGRAQIDVSKQTPKLVRYTSMAE